MKTNVRDTSLQAYDSLKINRGQQRVIDFMTKYPGRDWTRNELATMSGIPIQSVCGRVNELVAAGVLEERVRRACKFTGRQSHPVRLAPKQLTLDVAA